MVVNYRIYNFTTCQKVFNNLESRATIQYYLLSSTTPRITRFLGAQRNSTSKRLLLDQRQLFFKLYLIPIFWWMKAKGLNFGEAGRPGHKNMRRYLIMVSIKYHRISCFLERNIFQFITKYFIPVACRFKKKKSFIKIYSFFQLLYGKFR